MTDREVLALYRPLLPFLAQLCGPACEVLLHDVSRPEESVIAIENGYHSGRELGSPLTDLAYRIIDSGEYKTKDFLSNYAGAGKGKNFVSSTYFIKNEGKLIGLLCINRDMSAMAELENALQRLQRQCNLMTQLPEIQETLDVPLPKILENMVSAAIAESGLLPDRMNRNEKVAVVHKLADQGVLGMKGSVPEIARQLNISEPTVYRYINRET